MTSREWAIAAAVLDPELPVLTIEDLGILRSVDVSDGITVTITPTYSGCPAMEAIRDDILAAFADAGLTGARVEFALSPAWTTDWMTEQGRRRLEDYGVAPPGRRVALTLSVRCPQCGSPETQDLSRFGSTACKSLWACSACREPFDHFKTI